MLPALAPSKAKQLYRFAKRSRRNTARLKARVHQRELREAQNLRKSPTKRYDQHKSNVHDFTEPSYEDEYATRERQHRKYAKKVRRHLAEDTHAMTLHRESLGQYRNSTEGRTTRPKGRLIPHVGRNQAAKEWRASQDDISSSYRPRRKYVPPLTHYLQGFQTARVRGKHGNLGSRRRSNSSSSGSSSSRSNHASTEGGNKIISELSNSMIGTFVIHNEEEEEDHADMRRASLRKSGSRNPSSSSSSSPSSSSSSSSSTTVFSTNRASRLRNGLPNVRYYQWKDVSPTTRKRRLPKGSKYIPKAPRSRYALAALKMGRVHDKTNSSKRHSHNPGAIENIRPRTAETDIIYSNEPIQGHVVPDWEGIREGVEGETVLRTCQTVELVPHPDDLEAHQRDQKKHEVRAVVDLKTKDDGSVSLQLGVDGIDEEMKEDTEAVVDIHVLEMFGTNSYLFRVYDPFLADTHIIWIPFGQVKQLLADRAEIVDAIAQVARIRREPERLANMLREQVRLMKQYWRQAAKLLCSGFVLEHVRRADARTSLSPFTLLFHPKMVSVQRRITQLEDPLDHDPDKREISHAPVVAKSEKLILQRGFKIDNHLVILTVAEDLKRQLVVFRAYEMEEAKQYSCEVPFANLRYNPNRGLSKLDFMLLACDRLRFRAKKQANARRAATGELLKLTRAKLQLVFI